DNVVAFPAGTTLDEVVDRAITIVQESAKEKPEPRRRKGSKPPPNIVAAPSSRDAPDDPRFALPKDYVQLADAERNDELGDFLEWIANCEPKDEPAIRAEIKRLFYDFGDRWGGDAFSAALDRAIRGWPLDRAAREALLVAYEPFTHGDPGRVARASPIVAALPPIGLRRESETPHDPRDAKLARYLSLYRQFHRWWRGR
ncbi:MAG TPA: hypothetical protein VET85_00930, partial [Stellaceae bacterium]|nr:hypothetical protein [Stellaceae bacterium]